MHKSQLIRLLKGCSAKELKRLERYVQSPYFNTDAKVTALFQWVKRARPQYQAGFLAKEKVAQHLFPEHPKPNLALRRVMTNLAKLIKDFLTRVQLDQYPIFQQHLLLESLLDRNVDSLFLPTYKGIKRDLSKHEQTSNYFYNTFLLEQDYYKFTHRQNNRVAKSPFLDLLAHFELIYVVGKLKFCCELLNRKGIVQDKEQDLLITELKRIISVHAFEKLPIVRLYSSTLQMLQNRGEESYYQQLRADLLALKGEIADKDLYAVCLFCLNYCFYQVRQGKAIYWKEAFGLYRLMLGEKIVVRNETIAPYWFKNISITAARLKEFEWGIQFIEDYQSLLPKQQGESTLYFCKGALAFYQQQYEEALSCFLHVEFADFFDHLNNEMLVIKCYYELQEWVLIENRLDALRHYIKRHNAISEQHKVAYRNFINLLKRLLRILWHQKQGLLSKAVEQRLQKSIPKLATDVKEAKALVDKEWLLEKIDMLQKK